MAKSSQVARRSRVPSAPWRLPQLPGDSLPPSWLLLPLPFACGFVLGRCPLSVRKRLVLLWPRSFEASLRGMFIRSRPRQMIPVSFDSSSSSKIPGRSSPRNQFLIVCFFPPRPHSLTELTGRMFSSMSLMIMALFLDQLIPLHLRRRHPLLVVSSWAEQNEQVRRGTKIGKSRRAVWCDRADCASIPYAWIMQSCLEPCCNCN